MRGASSQGRQGACGSSSGSDAETLVGSFRPEPLQTRPQPTDARDGGIGSDGRIFEDLADIPAYAFG